MSSPRPVLPRAAWCAVASACMLCASVLTPRFATSRMLPAGSQLVAEVVQGIQFFRICLVETALLSIISIWWKRPSKACGPSFLSISRRADGLWLGILAGVAILVRWPNFQASFWWDELGTLVRVVRRGPPLIFIWSANGNNHVLNSALIYLLRLIGGESAATVRLPAFLFGCLLPPIGYWFIRRPLGRGAAAVTGLILALAPPCWIHSTEARGYSGAMLFSFLACAMLFTLLRQPTRLASVLYTLASVMAAGFIAISMIVPVAHAAATGILLVVTGRSRAVETGSRKEVLIHAWFTCCWALAAGLVFGFTVPQLLSYAAHGAERDHLLLGLPLIRELFTYFGGRSWEAGLLFLFLGVLGYFTCTAGRVWPVRTAFGTPMLLAAVSLLLPGARFTPRMFYFCMPPLAVGVALACKEVFLLPRLSPQRLSVAAVACLWIISCAILYDRFVSLKNPDLSGLSRRLQGRRVVLCGEHANLYYFPSARKWTPEKPLTNDSEPERTCYLIKGIEKNTTPDSGLLQMHFRLVEVLISWNQSQVSYQVYRRQFEPERSKVINHASVMGLGSRG